MKNYKENLAELTSLISGMNIPSHRKKPSNNDGLRWLAKCMAERNAEHKNFKRASDLLGELGHPVRISA